MILLCFKVRLLGWHIAWLNVVLLCGVMWVLHQHRCECNLYVRKYIYDRVYNAYGQQTLKVVLDLDYFIIWSWRVHLFQRTNLWNYWFELNDSSSFSWAFCSLLIEQGYRLEVNLISRYGDEQWIKLERM